jgi:small subunit ribosomal protein S16
VAVKLRLRRLGRKKLPIWGIVASDARSPRDGRFIEDFGRYFPLEEPARIEIQEDRALHWLERGAQPTETVRNLFSKQGIMLALHLKRKGKSEEEISAAVEQHRQNRSEKEGQSVKLTPAARRAQELEEERKRVAKDEEENRRKRAEADAKARQEAERAQKEAAEARAKAAEAARAEQEEANKATAAAEAEGAPVEDNTVPQDTPDVPAGEEAPAKEAGEESVTEEAVEQESEEKKAE